MFCLCSFFLLFSCTPKKIIEYRVGVPFLPEKIDPRTNIISTFHYMNIHLFYPLFEKTNEGQLDSFFLNMKETKSLDSTFQNYRLCLRDDTRFSDGSKITIQDFEASLKKTHQQLTYLPLYKSLAQAGEKCIEVVLQRPDLFYFDKLSSVQATILKANQNNAIGIGPYRIEKTDNRMFSLVATRPQTQIQKIKFIKIQTEAEGFEYRLDDWNNIITVPVPEKIRQVSNSVKRSMLKTYAIFVNYRTQKTRRYIQGCLKRTHIEDFIRETYSLIPSDSIIPKALLGSQKTELLSALITKMPENCSSNFSFGPSVEFACTGIKMCGVLKNYIDSAKSSLPFKVSLVEMSNDEYFKQTETRRELVTLLGLDTIVPESSCFFEGFFENKSATNDPVVEVGKLLKQANETDSLDSKNNLFIEAQKNLFVSGHLIPIGQQVTTFYYPKYVVNLQSLSRTMHYPRIDLFEIKL